MQEMLLHCLISIFTGLLIGIISHFTSKEIRKQHEITRNQLGTLGRITDPLEKIFYRIMELEKKLNLLVPADYQIQKKIDDMKNSLDDFLREYKKVELERKRQITSSADPPTQS